LELENYKFSSICDFRHIKPITAIYDRLTGQGILR